VRALLLFVLLIPTPAAAQDEPELPPPDLLEAPCAPDVDANRRALLEHDAEPGIWFHADVARCMAERLALLPAYARHVRLLEERVALSDERDALRAREVQLAADEAAAAREALEAAVRRAREAEADRDAWWRHPALWFAVGVVVTVALEVAAIYALDAIRL
jgi:hypothetical protein